jgi:hypothetical protein
MGVFEILKEALRIARTHKSLWLFGFLVGLGGGFDFGGGGGGGGGGGQLQLPVPNPAELGARSFVLLVALTVIVVFVVLKFLSTGALIEGVKRARSNGSMTVGEGFREGWAHWGVLFRIALLYFLVGLTSVAVLTGACYLVWLSFGSPAVVFAAGVALLVGVPWLLTLYMWQSFAERIAVLENRHALDAIRKARLFLHGRLELGLKLLVAGFLGVVFVTVVGLAVIAPLVVIARASAGLWGIGGAVGLAVLTVVPTAFVLFAIIGVTISSVWTIGYLSQVEQ